MALWNYDGIRTKRRVWTEGTIDIVVVNVSIHDSSGRGKCTAVVNAVIDRAFAQRVFFQNFR